MKNFRLLSVIVALFVLLIIMLPVPAQAKAKKPKLSAQTVKMINDKNDEQQVTLKNLNGAPVKWKSSNQDIVKIKKIKTTKNKSVVTFFPRDEGNATLTAIVGKKKYKVKVTVYSKEIKFNKYNTSIFSRESMTITAIHPLLKELETVTVSSSVAEAELKGMDVNIFTLELGSFNLRVTGKYRTKKGKEITLTGETNSITITNRIISEYFDDSACRQPKDMSGYCMDNVLVSVRYNYEQGATRSYMPVKITFLTSLYSGYSNDMEMRPLTTADGVPQKVFIDMILDGVVIETYSATANEAGEYNMMYIEFSHITQIDTNKKHIVSFDVRIG
ncbi:hypothetical protein [Butyrivibrio sp. WCE2006]|uniref:hypothetical protein n=1 Tax=Butyrivibrio sp. WCE2006 TaxID=1410611 RepID=UPI0005D1C770|nr:hypothetical protein [Butyrivibrio sp. WCE2006]